MTEARQIGRRSVAARAGLWCVGLTDAIAIPAGFLYASYLESLDPDAVVEELELGGPELAYALVGVVQLIALTLAAVFFIRWFYLAHRNLGDLSGEPPSHASGWAIWGFFVPILNLIRPQQLMREIWTTTSGIWEREASRVVGLARPSDLVNLWWAFFLATSFFGNAVGRASWRATTTQEMLWATWATLFADAFDIAAVLVTLALVRNVTALQRPLLGHAPAGPAV